MYVRVPGGKGNAKDVEELGSEPALPWGGLSAAGVPTVNLLVRVVVFPPDVTIAVKV
jgi:hypothetical protein